MRSFLSKWWSIADRDVICDQDAFDMLYKQYNTQHGQAYMKEKIAILARDALNSDPPAVSNQLEHNQVMHLVQLITNHYRAFYFSRWVKSRQCAKTSFTLDLKIFVGRCVRNHALRFNWACLADFCKIQHWKYTQVMYKISLKLRNDKIVI